MRERGRENESGEEEGEELNGPIHSALDVWLVQAYNDKTTTY